MAEQNLINPLIEFDSSEEFELHQEWLRTTDSPGEPGGFERYKAAQAQKCVVDLTKVAEALNALPAEPTAAVPGGTYRQSLTPMPSLASYTVNIPQYGGAGRQRITAAALKNKVLSSACLLMQNGTVYCFDGRCYQSISEPRLKQLISGICEEELNENGRFELVQGAMNFILSEPRIQVPEEVLNRRLLTFQNGNLDIESGQLTTHSPSVFTTFTVQCGYIPNCRLETPVFDALLHRISGNDAGIEQRIWEMFGYCLAPDMRAKKGFLLQGRKHSGKTLLCDFLASFFPPQMVSALPAHDFSSHFAISELEGRALCISGDMSAEPLNLKTVSYIKQLSGNDLISAAKKYKDNRQFRFGGKLVLVSNHQLLTQTYDDAFHDRLVAIPFPYTVPPEEQDGNLIERLKCERDAVASKALSAYWQLRSRAYRFSGVYELNSGSFLLDGPMGSDMDLQPVVRAFLMDNFVSAGYDSGLFLSDIYDLFSATGIVMPFTKFATLFGNAAIGFLNARKERKRKPGDVNPTSYLSGIALRQPTF